jgi:energy-coupling factor transport system ATP-binding protein
LSGRYRAYHGRIKNLPGKKVLLPQQPKYLFLEDRVEECFSKQKKMRELAGYFDLLSLAKRNPSDLSGGELQRLGLCRVLGTEAELYLLDEPTKGMDWKNKIRFGEYLRKMTEQGKTILMVSHDMEFAARYADYMALMFCGRMDLLTDRRNFFEENQFYTTGLNRIARGVSPHIITEEDIDIYAEKKSI